jgi:hypothetical protein
VVISTKASIAVSNSSSFLRHDKILVSRTSTSDSVIPNWTQLIRHRKAWNEIIKQE